MTTAQILNIVPVYSCVLLIILASSPILNQTQFTGDYLKKDVHFLLQVLVSLPDIPEISSNQTIEDMSVTLLPLKRPEEPDSGPYQVNNFNSS